MNSVERSKNLTEEFRLLWVHGNVITNQEPAADSLQEIAPRGTRDFR
jgi:hypothetical protein